MSQSSSLKVSVYAARYFHKDTLVGGFEENIVTSLVSVSDCDSRASSPSSSREREGVEGSGGTGSSPQRAEEAVAFEGPATGWSSTEAGAAVGWSGVACGMGSPVRGSNPSRVTAEQLAQSLEY